MSPPLTLRPITGAVLACHAVLAAVTGALVYSGASARLAGIVLALLAVAPLLVTFRAIATTAAARPWLALLLVIYAGAASVEVVASLGAAHLASVALLAAALELGLLLVLIRRSPARPRAGRE
jgi:hypothetical protein